MLKGGLTTAVRPARTSCARSACRPARLPRVPSARGRRQVWRVLAVADEAVKQQLEDKLAGELDPHRLSVDWSEGPKIEVASFKFEKLSIAEREALVKQIVASVDEEAAESLVVVPMTPNEYFTSLKKWC